MTKHKQPKAYTAPHPVYTAGIFTPPGEVFVTDAPPGKEWDEKTPAEAAIIEASANPLPGDPSLDELGVEALKAVAVTKNVNVVGLTSKKQLIDAIKAADEPTK